MEALRHLFGQPRDRAEVEERLSAREREVDEQTQRIEELRQAVNRRWDQDAADDARLRNELAMRRSRGGKG